MAVIAYNNRSFTQNTWTVMYNGGNDFAMTSFNALNIGTASSVGLAFAIGDGTIVDGSNNAFYANLEVNTFLCCKCLSQKTNMTTEVLII